MKTLLSFLFALLCITSKSQVKIKKLDKTAIPSSIKFSGQLKNAVTWKDNIGINYVLISETGEYKTNDKNGDEYKNAAFYVYHFITKDDSTTLLWRIYDFSKDCPFDLYVKLIDKAFKVTDLDKNGIAEVWIMYNNQCTSDVSPAPTKIIMYEGNKKYAVRGESRIQISDKNFVGGQYKLDEYFKTGNPLFRQFAINLWEKNKLQKW